MRRNLLFHDAEWQYPAKTEQHAFHRATASLSLEDGRVYLAFPWATLFDLLNRSHPRAEILLDRLQGLAKEIQGLRPLVVVTVCQHVDLIKHASVVASAGVTDVYWSHTSTDTSLLGITAFLTHPFPLFPVQISATVPSETKRPLLFSFTGAIEAPSYLTQSRLWIWKHLREHPKGRIIARSKWHYESDVYDTQIYGRAIHDSGRQTNKEQEFRYLMGSSTFCLCPSGSGPNTIRLWESIASGVIPVILSDRYLPPGPSEDWERAVVFCPENEEDIKILPERLEEISAAPSRIAEMRLALGKIAAKYGPDGFIGDINALFARRFDSFPALRSRIDRAFHSYRQRDYSKALEYFSELDAVPLRKEFRRSVRFFKKLCAYSGGS